MSFMNLTALETAQLFGVSREAIRNYSIEFARHLSPIANPQKGRQRMFAPSDLEVISYIIEQKAAGKLFADIHAGLSNGQRGDIPTHSSKPLVQPNERQLAIHQEQITLLSAQLDDVKKQLSQQVERAATAEGQVILLERQLAAANAALRDAYIEIGSLKKNE